MTLQTRNRTLSRASSVGIVALFTVAGIGAAVVWDRSGTSRASSPHSSRHLSSAVSASTITTDGLPEVGPLFPAGLRSDHTCTASVVASRTGNTILTAAHCLSGSVAGLLFAPGYRNGRTPYGVWRVTAAYVTTRWRLHQTPADDFAVLTVADRRVGGRSVTLSSVTGAERVGATPHRGTTIRVIAYNEGRNDAPHSCKTGLTSVHGHPTFFCHGFVGGSSGSPWLTGPASAPVVRGVIGGRHQGGCTEYTSHSPVFGPTVTALIIRAGRGGSGDTPPAAGGDNCPSTTT